MSYFNHAYKKTLLANTVSTTTAHKAHTLAPAAVAMCSSSTYGVINYATTPDEFLLVQGNLNKTTAAGTAATVANDTLGGNKHHGGYTHSIKSKVIKTKYINKLWKEASVDNTEQTIVLRVTDNCYTCTKHAQLRIDLKGEEVQRAFNRNYYTVVSSEGCCTMDGSTASLTSKNIVDAWAAAINEDEMLSEFVSAATADPGGQTYSTITLTLKADRMTKFDDCSFDTRDWYNTEPLKLILSEIDDEGDACSSGCIKDNAGADMPVEGLNILDLADATSGETILRDLIMDGRYRNDGGFNQGNRDSARFREIEKSGKAVIGAIDRNSRFDVFYLQHSVPRFNNPTGVFDNDQYVIQVAADKVNNAAAVTALGNMWTAIAANAKTSVGVDTYPVV